MKFENEKEDWLYTNWWRLRRDRLGPSPRMAAHGLDSFDAIAKAALAQARREALEVVRTEAAE